MFKHLTYGSSVFLLCLLHSASFAQNRPFTVRDDIAMVRFNEPSALDKDAAAKLSPDGKYFVVVTSRGILETDEIESDLALYSTREVRAFVAASTSAHAPSPRSTIRITAVPTSKQYDAYGSVITDVRWSGDSRSIYFLAEGKHGDRRIYRLDIETGKAIPITPESYTVARFDFTDKSVVYRAWRSGRGPNADVENGEDRINRDARAVTGEALTDILFPRSSLISTNRTLWEVVYDHGRPGFRAVETPPLRDIGLVPEAFAISPTGHWLIELQPVTKVPAGWSRYEPARGAEFRRIQSDDPGLTAANSATRLKEYSLVNLANGSVVPLIQAPHDYTLAYTYESRAIWSPDEQRVLLTNTFLPLDGIGEGERAKRLRPCAVAEVRLSSLESHCVLSQQAMARDRTEKLIQESLSFGRTDDEVNMTFRTSQNREEKRGYLFQDGNWRLTSTEDSPEEDNRAAGRGGTCNCSLRVTVKQGLNEPPTLWATKTDNGQSRQLWNPNPQFGGLKLGEASVYYWRDKSGYEWKGGLVKPVGYIVGKRYPLVIQIYDFHEDQFLTDGLFPTAMAARPLASAGIMVLQVQRKLPRTLDDTEVQAHVEAFRSAIAQLSNEGMIDEGKVGLVGFSGSAYYVENALIRDPTRFAAATIADGIDVSYMQYHLSGVSSPSLRTQFEKMIGAKPVGEVGLARWLKLAPGFHLDQIAAPVRLEAIRPESILGEWEIYSSLTEQNKPVDMIYFPDGQHIHQRPLERLVSQEGDVDWFRFWLQGYEDPCPKKRKQYTRWRKMKNVRQSNDGTGR